MLFVTLPEPVTYITQPELVQFGKIVQKETTNTVSEVSVREIIEDTVNKKIVARTLELGEDLVLWEGEDYPKAGWTEQEVANRIIEVLGS